LPAAIPPVGSSRTQAAERMLISIPGLQAHDDPENFTLIRHSSGDRKVHAIFLGLLVDTSQNLFFIVISFFKCKVFRPAADLIGSLLFRSGARQN
jgi:hypothetical protein